MNPFNHHHDTETQDFYQPPEDFPRVLSHTHVGTGSFRAEATAVMLEVVILAFTLSALIAGIVTQAPELRDLAINFVSIILEAVPFMMVGAVIGGMIEAFVPPEFVQRALSGHTTATVFVAAGMGMVFPICECAIVPIVRRLINKGVPLPAAIAFLLGAPIVNPIVAASTWLAYQGNWSMVTTRMVCGYVIAVSVALILGAMFRHEEGVLPTGGASCEHDCCHCEDHYHGPMQSSFLSKILDAFAHARDDFFTFGKFLIIGAFVAALARATIDVVAFRQLFASPMLSILAMMGLAVTLNLCSETDAFIAAGFRAVFPDTAQMAFMVLGPMLDLKLVLTYFTLFRSRMIGTLALLTITAVLIAMMVLHYGFGGLPGAK
ncbi:MAG TPA: permease [Desulfomonilaceae bacterium]|nr:permease [Desulfomonilaceae bacterium]